MGIGIKQRAQLIYKQLQDKAFKVGAKTLELVTGACVFKACKLEGAARSAAEFTTICRVDKFKLGQMEKKITETIGKEEMPPLQAESQGVGAALQYVGRFCYNLALKHEVKMSAEAIVKAAIEDGIAASKSPVTVAATAIYMVTLLMKGDQCKSAEEIAAECGLSVSTLKLGYKHFYAKADILVPKSLHPENLPLPAFSESGSSSSSASSAMKREALPGLPLPSVPKHL